MSKKEAWRGAGFKLAEVSEADFVKVEEHLEALPDTKEKIQCLQNLICDLEYAYSDIEERNMRALTKALAGGGSRSQSREAEPKSEAFRFWSKCQRALKKLTRLEKDLAYWEKQAEREKATVSVEDETAKPSDGKQSGSLARRVWIMMFLLEAANMGNEANNIEIARLIQFLGGGNLDNIRHLVGNPFYKRTKQKALIDLNSIRTYFEKLGLDDILRKIDQKTKALQG